jgi:Holliday junction resolvasome RuvABC endonuclease subunit
LTGTGSASKAGMITAARLRFGVEEITEHAADACGVALGAIKALKEARLREGLRRRLCR